MNRRRFITLCAGACVGLSGLAYGKTSPNKIQWQGQALGADASLTIYHKDQKFAEQLINYMLSEIKRLEMIFSLFQRDSEITRLNKDGYLKNPSAEMREVLKLAQEISSKTDGTFDITIQPLWALYRKHQFYGTNPTAREIDETLKLVNWQNISISSDKVAFTQKNMAITLNGIAQGYITDKVTDLLKQAGLKHVLVNMGEWKAIGQKPDHKDWQLALPNNALQGLSEGCAIATSSHQADLGMAHLYHPSAGQPIISKQFSSVIAPSAALADGLSTACALSDAEQAMIFMDKFENVTLIQGSLS